MQPGIWKRFHQRAEEGQHSRNEEQQMVVLRNRAEEVNAEQTPSIVFIILFIVVEFRGS